MKHRSTTCLLIGALALGGGALAVPSAAFAQQQRQAEKSLAEDLSWAGQELAKDLAEAVRENPRQAESQQERLLQLYDRRVKEILSRHNVDEGTYGFADRKEGSTMGMSISELEEELDETQYRIEAENRKHKRITDEIRSARESGDASRDRTEQLTERERRRHESVMDNLVQRRDHLRDRIENNEERRDDDRGGESLLDRLEREIGG